MTYSQNPNKNGTMREMCASWIDADVKTDSNASVALKIENAE